MNTRKNTAATGSKTPAQIRRDLEARVAALKTATVETEIVSTVALRESVADHVFEVMQEQDVSQAELARRLGKSRAYVCKILGGGANLTLDSLAALSAALDCRLEVCFQRQAGSTPEASTPSLKSAAQNTAFSDAPFSDWSVQRPTLEMLGGGAFKKKSKKKSCTAFLKSAHLNAQDSTTGVLRGEFTSVISREVENDSCEILKPAA